MLFGFKGKRVRLPVNNSQIVSIDDSYICELFDNYSNLVENSIRKAQINYFKLVQKFKILPNNFFKMFDVRALVIDEVNNYLHLFEFLKFCSQSETLRLYYTNIDSNLILGQLFISLPSLIVLKIFEDNHMKLIDLVTI